MICECGHDKGRHLAVSNRLNSEHKINKINMCLGQVKEHPFNDFSLPFRAPTCTCKNFSESLESVVGTVREEESR
jgi:hypothetical protein